MLVILSVIMYLSMEDFIYVNGTEAGIEVS